MNLFGDPVEDEFEDEYPDNDSDIPDAVESPFVAPRAMSFCEGHGLVEAELLDAYYSGRMPHALIFSGPKGIGKATMAYRLARFLLKEGINDGAQGGLFGEAPAVRTSLDVAANDPVFRRVAAAGHPDLASVERKYDDEKGKFKDILDVEEIRKIPPFLRKTSSEGGWRVVVIDDADCMNRSAQNALLKILEEPPAHALLILVAHRVGALIPTIRSRARRVPFLPLGPEMIASLIRRHDPAIGNADLDKLSALAEGSLGQALSLHASKALEVFESIDDLIKAPQWTRIHALSEQLSGPGSETSYRSFQDILLWQARRGVTAKARGQTVSAAGFLKNSSLEEALKICENLEKHFYRADAANLDRRQTVLGAFSLIG